MMAQPSSCVTDSAAIRGQHCGHTAVQHFHHSNPNATVPKTHPPSFLKVTRNKNGAIYTTQQSSALCALNT